MQLIWMEFEIFASSLSKYCSILIQSYIIIRNLTVNIDLLLVEQIVGYASGEDYNDSAQAW